MRLYLLLFSLILFFTSCENSTVAPNEQILGLQYFPMNFDDIATYQVEEINYNNDGTIDTSRYLLQDEWEDSIAIQGGSELQGYRVQINQNGSREIVSSIVKRRTDKLAKLQLGNKEEVKLSFPISEDRSWNGRPQEFKEDQFIISNAFKTYQLADSVFEETIQVIQEDNGDSVSNYDQRIEIYARNAGMIYKISSQLEFCRDTECLGLQEIEFGRTVRIRRLFETQ